MERSLIACAALLTLVLAGCDGTPPSPVPPPVTTSTAATEPAPPEATTAPKPAPPEATGAPEAAPTEATGAPAQPDEEEQAAPRTSVPKKLVGTWDGDRAQISFSRAGDVTIISKQGGGGDTGTVVIDGSSMTLHLSGGVQTIADWEITRFDAGYGYEFYNLILDGTSYVRDVPK